MAMRWWKWKAAASDGMGQQPRERPATAGPDGVFVARRQEFVAQIAVGETSEPHLAGVAVLSGQAWGRFVGMALAGLSIIAHFLFLRHHPLWSIVIIALDVAIIWALAVYHDTNPTSQAATPYS